MIQVALSQIKNCLIWEYYALTGIRCARKIQESLDVSNCVLTSLSPRYTHNHAIPSDERTFTEEHFVMFFHFFLFFFLKFQSNKGMISFSCLLSGSCFDRNVTAICQIKFLFMFGVCAYYYMMTYLGDACKILSFPKKLLLQLIWRWKCPSLWLFYCISITFCR